jgi:hypothetical protein
MTIDKIAEVAHETNRAYCRSIGDVSQIPWEEAPDWQKESSIKGVQFRLDNPEAPVSAQHEAWFADKRADGWLFGPVKDPASKKHPCCMPYGELPEEQKVKDALFAGVVNAMKILL